MNIVPTPPATGAIRPDEAQVAKALRGFLADIDGLLRELRQSYRLSGGEKLGYLGSVH